MRSLGARSQIQSLRRQRSVVLTDSATPEQRTTRSPPRQRSSQARGTAFAMSDARGMYRTPTRTTRRQASSRRQVSGSPWWARAPEHRLREPSPTWSRGRHLRRCCASARGSSMGVIGRGPPRLVGPSRRSQAAPRRRGGTPRPDLVGTDDRPWSRDKNRAPIRMTRTIKVTPLTAGSGMVPIGARGVTSWAFERAVLRDEFSRRCSSTRAQ